MPAESSEAAVTAQDLLLAACARNLSAEIHYEDRDELRVARMRLLRLTEEEVRIDFPQTDCRELAIRPRAAITVYFRHEGVIYCFHSRIIRPLLIEDLNHEKRVRGVAIEIPHNVSKQQRRRDYRVSLARHDVAALLHRTDPDNPVAARLPGRSFDVRVTNVSSGGMSAMMAPATPGLRFAIGERLYAIFTLPQSATRYVLPVDIRYSRELKNGERIVLGLQFRNVLAPEIRTQLHQLRHSLQEERAARLASAEVRSITARNVLDTSAGRL